jgi:hypothetical protein
MKVELYKIDELIKIFQEADVNEHLRKCFLTIFFELKRLDKEIEKIYDHINDYDD